MPAGIITALRPQERDTQRVNIFIDEAFALGVSLDTLTREELYVGKLINEEQWARLEAAESADKAFRAAVRFLQARPRSVAEVRERLQRRQVSTEVIDRTVARLSEFGMLDDEAFARFWVENRNACRPRGPQALRQELYHKGIERDVVDATLSDDELVGDVYTRALTLARGVLPKYAASADRVVFHRRMGGYLQRRGFSYDIIKRIVDDLWREVSDL
jgi:regulatory protein